MANTTDLPPGQLPAADPLTAFAATARTFTTWCDAPLPPGATPKLVFTDLRRQLVALYLAALDLPRPMETETEAEWRPRAGGPSEVTAAPVVWPNHCQGKLDLLGIGRYRYAFVPTVDTLSSI